MDDTRLSLWKHRPEESVTYENQLPCAFPWRREHPEDAVRYVKGSDGWYFVPGAPENGKALLSCVGDLMSEPLLDRSSRYGDGYVFAPSFQFVRDILKHSDFAVGNLETTVTDATPYAGEYHNIAGNYHCNAPESYLDALRYAGFDALVNANNHNVDSGAYGLCETVRYIRKHGFMQTGTFLSPEDDRVLLVRVNGIKMAVLSYAHRFNRLDTNLTAEGKETLLNGYTEEKAKRDIARAKECGAEFILCYMHWGNEHVFYPVEEQKQWAKELAEAGCDYIVGSHSHCLQTHDTVVASDGRRVPVIYSLGNFISSAQSEINKVCGILQLGLIKSDGKITVSEFFIPCRIVDQGGCYCVMPTDPVLNGGYHSEELSRAERFARAVFPDVTMRKTAALEAPLLSVVSTGTCTTAPEKMEDLLSDPLFSFEDADAAYKLSQKFAVNPKARVAGVTATGFCTKTDSVRKGSVYFDLDSDMLSVHEAIRCGAGVIASAAYSLVLPISHVSQPEEAYIHTVRAVRNRFGAKTVFLSGESGKTLTKNIAFSVLSEKYRVFTHPDGKTVPEDAWTALHPFDEIDLEEFRSFSPEDARRTARAIEPEVWVILDTMGKTKEEMQEYLEAVQCGAKRVLLNADVPLLSELAAQYGTEVFSARDLPKVWPLPAMAPSFAAAEKIGDIFGCDSAAVLSRFDHFDYTQNVMDIDGVKLVLSATVKRAETAAGAIAWANEQSITVFAAPDNDSDSDWDRYRNVIRQCPGTVILYGKKLCAERDSFSDVLTAQDRQSLETLLAKEMREGITVILVGGRNADYSRTVRRLFGLCDGYIAEEFTNR